MKTLSIRISYDHAAAGAGALALAQLAQRLPEIRDCLVGLLQRGAAFDLNRLPAAGADELRTGFQLSEALLEGLRAAGASDVDLRIVEKAFGLELCSVDGLATETVAQDGEVGR